jgi:Protein of unknown function (DUF3443)
MAAIMRAARAGIAAMLCLCAVACGGGSSGSLSPAPSPIPPTGTNVAAVIVDEGPSNNSVNTLFTSVTLCEPNTTTCQTIDHIQVDTGSYGMRVLSTVLSLTLPKQLAASGNPLVECTQFADGYSWGPIEIADLQIAGESAKGLPLQVIGDSTYTTVPADCSSTGMAEDTVMAFGANGIIGIGPFAVNCPACAMQVIPGTYYSCATPSTCVGTMAADNIQEPNPIALFAADNNGSIIDLPAVTSTGQLTVSGSLIFGIDTQSNNESGTQTVLTVDQNANLTMTYDGQALNQSFIDSGSNGIYFTSNIVLCTGNLSDFYCPSNTLNQTVDLQGQNGVMVNNMPFMVGNAQNMFTMNPTFNAFPMLAGTNPNAQSFDLGLPFFYGKRVAVALENNKTSAGTGPYVAF